MAHSQALRAERALIAIELLLYAVAATSGYLSATNRWLWFGVVSVLGLALLSISCVSKARPRLAELQFLEDAAAKMARGALVYGVDRFYNMQRTDDQNARNSDTIEAIRNAQAMWLCANSGASYLDAGVYRHWSAAEVRLRDGVPFKVVLLDPVSDEKRFRNQLNVGEEAHDSKLSISNLVRLYNEYPTLEVRLVRHGMHATVFATPDALFYDPYHAAVVGRRIENRSFCLRVQRAAPPHASGYYDLFRAHFDTLWRLSEDFETWLDANSQYLPAPPGTLRRRHRRADAG